MNAAAAVKPMRAPTALVYSALLFEGRGPLVSLAGNVSEGRCLE